MFLRLHFERNVYNLVDEFDQSIVATEGSDRERIQEFFDSISWFCSQG